MEYKRKVDKKRIPTCNIMGVNIAAINMEWLVDYLEKNISEIKGDYICVSNVHTTVTSFEDADYCAIQNGGLMAIPDGGPLSTVGQKRGHKNMERTTGPSLMGEIFEISAKKGYRHYFYVHVVNELDVPILCMGLKDVVVSASPEGILVSDKEQSSYIKPYVNTLDHRVMFAEKSWGSFKVIDIDKASMTIKVTLNAGHQMNYHSHQHRDEVWTVIAGKGKTIVDGMEQNVKAGDVITMSAGCRHTVIAETELKLIEVQLGEAIDVHDKQKFELEY